VAAPAGQLAAGGEEASPADEVVTVTFMVPGSANEDADFAPVFEEFNKRYPEIDAQYTPAGTGYNAQYNDKLLTMLAGGTAPDTFKTLFGYFGSLANSGVYVPLDDFVAKYPDETAFDDFFQNHVDACKFQGTLYALPNDGAPNGYWYNVDLYDGAGVDYPDWDTNWDEVVESAKAITKEENGVTTYFGVGHPLWTSWIWSNGGEVLNEDGTKCLLDQPDAVEALQYMQDLVTVYGVSPGPEALSEMNEGDRFTTGRLGAFVGVRGSLGSLRSIEDFHFDAAALPLSPKGERVTQLAIGWTSVWTGTQHPDEAYLLTAWVASPEGQELRISRGFAHPSRKSLVEQPWFADYQCDMCNTTGVNTAFSEMLMRGEAKAWPAHPKESEIVQVVNTELDALWDGSMSGEEVGVSMTQQIDAIITG
jgi:multiple sugar transport system substrate-binding protein